MVLQVLSQDSLCDRSALRERSCPIYRSGESGPEMSVSLSLQGKQEFRLIMWLSVSHNTTPLVFPFSEFLTHMHNLKKYTVAQLFLWLDNQHKFHFP
jgi:hypothetical protein